jgi:flagellar capping protein FliD
MNNITQKIEELQKMLDIYPNDNKLKQELRRLKSELNDRLSLLDMDAEEKTIDESSNQSSEQEVVPRETRQGAVKVNFISDKLNESFCWDQSARQIVFQNGAVYSESEVLELHQDENIDNIMLRCIHQIKTEFPNAYKVESVPNVPVIDSNDIDELDELFKNLKG